MLGVWGGDMGMLMLMMAVYDEKKIETTGTPLSGADIQHTVKRYIKRTKRKVGEEETERRRDGETKRIERRKQKRRERLI